MRIIYKVFRSVILTVLFTVVALYLVLYVFLSFPGVRNIIKEEIETELSGLFESRLEIGEFIFKPFNEIVVDNILLYDQSGEECVAIERVGAGVDIIKLISEWKIRINYAEILGLNLSLRQKEKDSPLNIQFIIDAFSPKDDNKKETAFDLNIKNIVLRRCSLSFDKEWSERKSNPLEFDPAHFKVDNLRGDLAFPRLSDKEIRVMLRRLAFNVSGGLVVDRLAFDASISPEQFKMTDFRLFFPESEIKLSDIELQYNGYKDIKNSLERGEHRLEISSSKITPSDFSAFYMPLRDIISPIDFNLELEGNISEAFDYDLTMGIKEDVLLAAKGDIQFSENTIPESINLDELNLAINHEGMTQLAYAMNPHLSEKSTEMLSMIAPLTLNLKSGFSKKTGLLECTTELTTNIGGLNLTGEAQIDNNKLRGGSIEGEIKDVDLALLFPKTDLKNVDASFTSTFEGAGADLTGVLTFELSGFTYRNRDYEGGELIIEKELDAMSLNLAADNEIVRGNINIGLQGENLDPENFWKKPLTAMFNCEIESFNSGLLAGNEGASQFFSGRIRGELNGQYPDEIEGEIEVNDFVWEKNEKRLSLENLKINSAIEDGNKDITITSDFIDGEITGDFSFVEIKNDILGIGYEFFPTFISRPEFGPHPSNHVDFQFLLKEERALTDFFHLPVTMLTDIPIEGFIDGKSLSAGLSADVPYLLKGNDKLIHDSRLNLSVDGFENEFNLTLTTVMPVKNGEMELNLRAEGERNLIKTDIGWRHVTDAAYKGDLKINIDAQKNPFTNIPELKVAILPSSFSLGAEKWFVNRGDISYSDKYITVAGLKVWHDNQMVEIEGVASSNPEDVMLVSLKDIDVDYIFDTLNINYVDFGGVATGEVIGQGLLGAQRRAETKDLVIENLTYNETLMGRGEVSGRWLENEKKVAIEADIRKDSISGVIGSGGIWLGKDSLSFDLAAKKVDVGFIKPFMQAFSSDIKGVASGEIKLFGTFKDIDMTGKAMADSVDIKLDFTNTWYHGSDSIYFNPGEISIPGFRVYDKFENSALLSGTVTHRYFHEPRFLFKVSDMNNLLSYDTNSSINPDWYGNFFCSGNASVIGDDEKVVISIDVTVDSNSSFTFVLNETQVAEDYHFLTFTDKNKTETEITISEIDEIRNSILKKKNAQEAQSSSTFILEIRASVNPGLLVTLVMDPKAGDKITARGSGALQVEYESKNDEMMMFGRYEIDEGNYNFSLQDLILRDFKILSGSSISFNGDPLRAELDISASYRVNTNLSDLDKSFSTDRDLNRTNVPVDAILMVKGETTHPAITFDISLPTLTQDVERKVRSIISTDDMMNRQIIYLLALNKFYTPEYMGSAGNGGELTAVASTTLSSQISNLISQLTDKFTLSPSFRSDKGDFSDIEVDVALSSSLLNNRLLVNGNFGYRDRSTSNTTFVGDFDIEYLLNKNGNIRLKAYNHFNDQNYYLRQALTTQGLGIVFKKDFDNPFRSVKAKREEDDNQEKKNAEEAEENKIETGTETEEEKGMETEVEAGVKTEESKSQ